MTSIDPAPSLRRPAERETLVSVVIPTYNRAALIGQAVQSVLAQTWTDLEVLVVDDGSTDATGGILESMARADHRVRPLRQANAGVSAARNLGLAHCRGARIAFLDSDDVWHPWKLKAQMQVLEALPQAGMVWTDMHAVDRSGCIVHRNFLRRMYRGYARITSARLFGNSAAAGDIVPHIEQVAADAPLGWGRIHSQMLFGNLVHTSTVLIRRERAAAAAPFDESLRFGGEDYKFHLATTRQGDVAFLDVATTDYRIGCDDQITHARNQRSFADAFLRTIVDERNSHSGEILLAPHEWATIHAAAHEWLASACIEEGDRRQAAQHAIAALRRQPAALTAWKTLAKTLLPSSAVTLIRRLKRARSIENRSAWSFDPS